MSPVYGVLFRGEISQNALWVTLLAVAVPAAFVGWFTFSQLTHYYVPYEVGPTDSLYPLHGPSFSTSTVLERSVDGWHVNSVCERNVDEVRSTEQRDGRNLCSDDRNEACARLYGWLF